MIKDDTITEDDFLGGRLRLRQPQRGHRAGHDAILLAAATPAQLGDRVVDFGAGVGAAGLAVARRVGGIDLMLVEIDPELAALARQNAAINMLQTQVVVLDVAASAAEFVTVGLPPESVDQILMNPPFNDGLRHPPSPDAKRSRAHQAIGNILDAWIHAARRVLRPGGTLTLIWRADALSQVLMSLDTGLGSIRLLPVHPNAMSPAIRVIVTAAKGSRAPLVLCPPLILNDEFGKPCPRVQAVLRGEGTLP